MIEWASRARWVVAVIIGVSVYFLIHSFDIMLGTWVVGEWDEPQPEHWYISVGQLLSALQFSMPGYAAGLYMGRRGFLIGAIVGAVSYPLVSLTPFVWKHIISSPIGLVAGQLALILMFAIIGAMSGAAGELSALRRRQLIRA